MKPLVLINFKVYSEVLGKRGLFLAEKLAQVKSNKYEIAIAPSLMEAAEIAHTVNIPVYAQHADAFLEGAHTGSIAIAELKLQGFQGIILNHSEKMIPWAQIKATIHLAKKEGLKVVVCASSLQQVKKCATLNPDFIAYEPKKLIGGNISVTAIKPKVIGQAVKEVTKRNRKIKLLCGAGVHSPEDVKQALALGAEGVLLAHAVVKAKDPQKFLREMLH